MRHVLFAAVSVLYVVIIGQNWAVYAAAFMAAIWIRQAGRFDTGLESVQIDFMSRRN